MITIVLLNISGSLVRVECDGVARDNLLAGNVVLAGCRELDTEARNGGTLDTRVWSVPESAIISYAVGKLPVKEEPAPAPVEAAPAPAEPTLELTMTEEQKAARRARYERLDDMARAGRAKRVPAATKKAPSKKAKKA